MYDVLHYVEDVLLQGLLTTVFLFCVNRWYERRIAKQRAKVAALFIVFEINDHYANFVTAIKKKTFPKPDEIDFCFLSKSWEAFRSDLVPLLEYKDLKDLVNYYSTINLIQSMTRHSEPYSKHETLMAIGLNSSKHFCELLGGLADGLNSGSTGGSDTPHVPQGKSQG